MTAGSFWPAVKSAVWGREKQHDCRVAADLLTRIPLPGYGARCPTDAWWLGLWGLGTESGVALSAATSVDGPGMFWNSRSLRFMLPIRPDDRVLVLGASPALAASLDAQGVSVLSVTGTSGAREALQLRGDVAIAGRDVLPCGDATVSHVLVPEVPQDQAGLLPTEIARVLRPGGGLFLGMPYRLRSRNTSATYIRAGRRRLEAGGFTDIEVYGVLYNLARPRHLVPLDSSAALRWYFDSAYLPLSRKGALAVHAARAAARFKAPPALFPALGFVARRRCEPC